MMLRRTRILVAGWHADCSPVTIRHAHIPVANGATKFNTGSRSGNSAVPNEKGYDMQTLVDAILEVKRELQVRSRVYPRMVADGRLSQQEANRREDAMLSALRWLEKLRDGDTGTQPVDPETTHTPVHVRD
jgi:hypothetical protein